MLKSITRRDLLKFTGGSIIGLMFSPLPWKLLDDSAIWTQNWSLTPKLAHGPITSVFTHCTLCPAGCAMKALCVSGMPFSLTGVPFHPLTHGSLCVRGLAGHHMAYHPLRIVHPHTFSGKSEESSMSAISLKRALDAIAGHMKSTTGTIAILDRQPNRAISELYRSFLQQTERGLYLTSPSREESTLDAIKEMVKPSPGPLGYDFENTSLIISFGAPLLDGWGTPGRMNAIRNSQRAKIVQIDCRYSRTALQSDQWIAIAPGTERLVALSIASVLEEEHFIAQRIRQSITDIRQFSSMIGQFSPEKTAARTGIQPSVLRMLTRELASVNSAIVLSGADPGGGPFDIETERTIAAINLLLGSVGKNGGIVSRKNIPGYQSEFTPIHWSNIPDHSIDTLIVDGADSGYAIPWRLIEQKLTNTSSMVVSLSPVLDQISVHSDYLLPSPAHLESLQDQVANIDAKTATFSLSIPLLKKNENTIDPVDVLRELSARLNVVLEIPTEEELLKNKVAQIHSGQRGILFTYSDGSSTSIRELSSADDLWTALTTGAIWIDDEIHQLPPRSVTMALSAEQPKDSKEEPLQMIASGWRGAVCASQISPILSKVFQETELRHVNGIVSINPETASQLGVTNDSPMTLSTKNGSAAVNVKIDTTVRPGIVDAAIGPNLNGTETPAHPVGNTLLNLCDVTNDGTWRITPAQILKV